MLAGEIRAMLSENLDKVRNASDGYSRMLEHGLNSSRVP
jgi:hypothetical protein